MKIILPHIIPIRPIHHNFLRKEPVPNKIARIANNKTKSGANIVNSRAIITEIIDKPNHRQTK